MRMCTVVNCGRGDYQLCRWRKTNREVHSCNNKVVAHCLCLAPFEIFPFPQRKVLTSEVEKINYAFFVFTYLNSCSLALCNGLFHLWPHALAASVYLIVSTGQFHCMLPSNYFNIDIFYL